MPGSRLRHNPLEAPDQLGGMADGTTLAKLPLAHEREDGLPEATGWRNPNGPARLDRRVLLCSARRGSRRCFADHAGPVRASAHSSPASTASSRRRGWSPKTSARPAPTRPQKQSPRQARRLAVGAARGIPAARTVLLLRGYGQQPARVRLLHRALILPLDAYTLSVCLRAGFQSMSAGLRSARRLAACVRAHPTRSRPAFLDCKGRLGTAP